MTNTERDIPARRASDGVQTIRVVLMNAAATSPVRPLVDQIPLIETTCRQFTTDEPQGLETEVFDLILIDVGTLVDWPRAMDELRSTYPNVPVIAIANRAEEDAALSQLQHGVSDYLLIENLDLDNITRALRYALTLSRLHRRVHDLNRNLEVANYRLRELFLPVMEQPKKETRIVPMPMGSIRGGASAPAH
jgi:CheY-like chemotaxis protein